MDQLLTKAQAYKERVAIISDDCSYTYAQLKEDSGSLASALLGDRTDLSEGRVAFMIDPSYAYTVTQWAVWRAGGIAVPLCTSHPVSSIRYVLEDAEVAKLVISEKYRAMLEAVSKELTIELLTYSTSSIVQKELPQISEERSAMILYTSGTTGAPKGVVTTHKNIAFCIQALVHAWSWSKEDHILNILPLHHVHGIINVMSCALWSGATCEFLPKFDAEQVWGKFQEGSLTLFMAVPTIYYKLIRHHEAASEKEQRDMSDSCNSFRLMVSGSAALPVPVLEKWQRVTGQLLLERYGMTEIGMALSNPYEGERRPGHVGHPLPGVSVRLADESDKACEKAASGEIQVKGPNIFKHYYNRPEATAESFTDDGWFKTGDIAVLSNGYYKILGRNSVDIIKSGGYKISALEIESELLKHPTIEQAGVVGIPDEEWGEVVAVALVANREEDPSIFKEWLSDKLPNYKIPRRYIYVSDLPKNTLGKVTKNKLKEMF